MFLNSNLAAGCGLSSRKSTLVGSEGSGEVSVSLLWSQFVQLQIMLP